MARAQPLPRHLEAPPSKPPASPHECRHSYVTHLRAKGINCPAGKRRTGASISPRRTGYGFNGLVRNTGVAIDPSGNVWLANNWKNVPIQTNPGGYQIVAYLGLAAPVKTPLVGEPEQP